MPEIISGGVSHKGKASWWDGHAKTLCGKRFDSRSYKEPFLHGPPTCPDCKRGMAEGKTLSAA